MLDHVFTGALLLFEYIQRWGALFMKGSPGMGILRIFPHLRIFLSVLPISRISGDFCSFEFSAL